MDTVNAVDTVNAMQWSGNAVDAIYAVDAVGE